MTVNKALVVDDSNLVRVVLKRMLEARGLGVDTAASGHDALEYLKSQVPDVIFMDYMMAGLDGYEVTAMIRKNPQTSTIPVFMCTGNDTTQEQSRAHECGADGFVTKPVSEAALDGLLAELRGRVAAPRPSLAPAATLAAAPVPEEDIARIAERIAHDVAQRLVHEATAAMAATSEQSIRTTAQTVAASAVQDAMASWRAEAAATHERAEQVAIAAAEKAAQAVVHRGADDAAAARSAAEQAAETRLREALDAVQSTAERIARETLDSAKASIEDASRRILESAQADLHESARTTSEAAAKPVAEAAARAVVGEMTREQAAPAQEIDPVWRSQLEQSAVAAAEQAAQAIVRKSAAEADDARGRAAKEADEARALAEKTVDDKLREALLTVQSTSERIAGERLDAGKQAIEDASRQIVDSAREDLQEAGRRAAEAAAKPVAETVARAVTEQVIRDTLAAAREEEAASRKRTEQAAIAIAERVGRELVQLAFGAAAAKPPAAVGDRIEATESGRAQETGTLDERVAAMNGEAVESISATDAADGTENADMQRAETPSKPDAAAENRPVATQSSWTAPRALVPWLAALTAAVLYLLAKTFL